MASIRFRRVVFFLAYISRKIINQYNLFGRQFGYMYQIYKTVYDPVISFLEMYP